MELGFVGMVADAAAQVITQFDRKGQATQLAIAQANQATAEANAKTTTPQTSQSWIVWVIFAAIALFLLWLVFKKR